MHKRGIKNEKKTVLNYTKEPKKSKKKTAPTADTMPEPLRPRHVRM